MLTGSHMAAGDTELKYQFVVRTTQLVTNFKLP